MHIVVEPIFELLQYARMYVSRFLFTRYVRQVNTIGNQYESVARPKGVLMGIWIRPERI